MVRASLIVEGSQQEEDLSNFEAEQEGVGADEVDQTHVSAVQQLVEVVLKQCVKLAVNEQVLTGGWCLTFLTLLLFRTHGDSELVVVLPEILVHHQVQEFQKLKAGYLVFELHGDEFWWFHFSA